MDMKEIRELVGILEGSCLATLEISENGRTIKLGKYPTVGLENAGAVSNMGAASSASAVSNMGAAQNNQGPSLDLEAAGQTVANGGQGSSGMENSTLAEEPAGEPVTSPMVGVFYSKPSPDAEAYVKVGTRVTKGQTLCIVEAMKLMNEIPAEKDGVITKIYPKDGDLVEYGQKLFEIGD